MYFLVLVHIFMGSQRVGFVVILYGVLAEFELKVLALAVGGVADIANSHSRSQRASIQDLAFSLHSDAEHIPKLCERLLKSSGRP